MTKMDDLVSDADLQQLSMMLDGEMTDEALDVMLERISSEPALGEAWSRLSQIQAATHRHAQAFFEIDLSRSIQHQIDEACGAKTSSTILNFPLSRQTPQVKESQKSDEPALPQVAQEGIQAQSLFSDYTGVERRKYREDKPPKRSLRSQIFAHLAVAASVASFTVWVQNTVVYSNNGAGQLASEAAIDQFNAAKAQPVGLLPGALADQGLPLSTVGNGDSRHASLKPITLKESGGQNQAGATVETLSIQNTSSGSMKE